MTKHRKHNAPKARSVESLDAERRCAEDRDRLQLMVWRTMLWAGGHPLYARALALRKEPAAYFMMMVAWADQRVATGEAQVRFR